MAACAGEACVLFAGQATQVAGIKKARTSCTGFWDLHQLLDAIDRFEQAIVGVVSEMRM